jgi:hypothetical protein
MNSILTSLPVILPIVYAWAEKQEMILLAEGEPLTESEMADARTARVAHPEKIRVFRAESLPHPANEDVMFLAHQIGLFSERTGGLSLGYGVSLRQPFWTDRYTLVHECVHVSQYESRGIRSFLSEYLRECIEPGYPLGRLEQEAVHVAKDICRRPVKTGPEGQNP